MNASTHSLRVSRVIEADRDTLFRAWTDPRELAEWWRQDGDGWAFAEASVDLRVGGRYRLGMIAPEGRRHVAVGVYREIQRPGRLVFTWDWEDVPNGIGETLVTVEFKAVDADRTEIVVTHERFVEAARLGRHEQGWTELLALLEHHVKGGTA